MAMQGRPDNAISVSAHLVAAVVMAVLAVLQGSSAEAQPSPGYYPSSMVRSTPFSQPFSVLWGPQHQSLSTDQTALTLWLDRTSGSGFKTKRAYRNGYFGVSMKVQPGYTAGVNTAFYLSNTEVYPGYHDEIDIELLGTIPGEPYTLQTNVYVRGTGDSHPIVGREMRFHLWFDPTADYHHYAVLWNPDEIVFLVDDVPVRRYEKKVEATFPEREMWAYGSVWDASDWATDSGRYRADYRYQPFVSGFREFKVAGCEVGVVQSRAGGACWCWGWAERAADGRDEVGAAEVHGVLLLPGWIQGSLQLPRVLAAS